MSGNMNRAPSDLAERLRGISESQRMDFDSPDVAATLDEAAGALEALTAEMHSRELHHFETEKLLTEAGIDPDAAHAEPDNAERESALARDRAEWYVDHEAEPGIAANAFERGFAAGFRRRGTNGYQIFGTPATVEQVKEVKAVADAWMVSGPNPLRHLRAQESLIREWPTLGLALRELARYLVLNREPTESQTGDER